LGLVLSRSDAKFKPITYNLYLAASKLEYGPAAMVLLSMAIDGKYSNRPELEPALVQLDQMVKQDNGPAIYLKGRLFEAQGEPEMALVMYEKAASILPNGYAAGDTMDETPAQAYASIVCLKAQNNDWPGLMAALEKAALQHDDPASIFAYAENSRSRDHPEWLFYMTKSAISGDYRATWRLGIYHARRFVKALSQPEEASRMAVWTKGMLMRLGLGSLFPRRAVDDSRDLALEWLSMAAMTVDRDRQTVGDSEVIAEISAMIDEGHFYLGLLLREKGDTVRGLQMLDLAAASPQLAEYAVPFFRHHWHNQDMALKNLDVDGIITGQMVI
jgi:tetratricopeptide (TPR) repeat protein